MNYFIFKTLLLLIMLLITLFCSIEISYLFIHDATNHHFNKYLWLVFIYFSTYTYYKLLSRRMVTTSETINIIKANFTSLVISLSIIFITKESDHFSRTIIILFFLFSMLIPVFVFLGKKYFMQFGFLRAKIFVLCDQPGRQNVDQWLSPANAFGFDIDQIISIENATLKEVKSTIDTALESGKYHAAVIAIDKGINKKSLYYIDHIQEKISRIIVLPQISSMPLFNAEIISSINHKGLAFFIKNNLLNPVDQFVKKIFDICVSWFLIIISLPFLLGLYVLVFIATKGHPIFKQRRVGEGGKSFNIYKFRTMYIDASQRLEELIESNPQIKKEWEEEFKLKDDPRITKIGRFLRKTSLDELPQILNVLQGKMSLVGPRPIIEKEIAKYGEYFAYFKAVKPGITGLWQVSGRSDLNYNERVQLDVWYVRNWSAGLDIIILIKTFATVLSKKGSY